MAIEHHDGRTYYYKKVRTGDRVSSVYMGSGELALLAHQLFLCDRRERLVARLEEKEDIEALMQGDQLVSVICAGIEGITQEALEAAGYHKPQRGRWRRKRGR
jgi:hypothetical protein